MKIKNASIPYMGSKRKLAPKIIDKILEDNPNCKYIYDLFGGGAAISLEAIQRPQIKKVFYNELDTGVASLLEELTTNGFSQWMLNPITREQFKDLKDRPDALGGLVKTCWSFGNKGNSYMYGQKIEDNKLRLHKMIVEACEISRTEFNKCFDTEIISKKDIEFKEETLKERRLRITKIVKNYTKNREDVQSLASLEKLKMVKFLQRVSRVQNLESIEDLKRIEDLDGLKITNLSYENVKIETPIDETIIYLDPPYKNTEKYSNELDFDELYKWIGNHPYKIYISEYNLPFECVKEFEHRSILSATNNNKKVIEKLYVNK